jgi:hypothetical protein
MMVYDVDCNGSFEDAMASAAARIRNLARAAMEADAIRWSKRYARRDPDLLAQLIEHRQRQLELWCDQQLEARPSIASTRPANLPRPVPISSAKADTRARTAWLFGYMCFP